MNTRAFIACLATPLLAAIAGATFLAAALVHHPGTTPSVTCTDVERAVYVYAHNNGAEVNYIHCQRVSLVGPSSWSATVDLKGPGLGPASLWSFHLVYAPLAVVDEIHVR